MPWAPCHEMPSLPSACRKLPCRNGSSGSWVQAGVPTALLFTHCLGRGGSVHACSRAVSFSVSKSGREHRRALTAHSSASLGASDCGALPEAASNGGPGRKPRLLRGGSIKMEIDPQIAFIPPWRSGSTWGSSPFLSLSWGKFPDLDFS